MTEGNSDTSVTTTDAPDTDTAIATLEASLPKLAQFDPTAPATFGNSLLDSLIKSEAFDQNLSELQGKNEDVKRFIVFETTKAVMYAAENGKDINIFAIFDGSAKAVEKLNTKLLQFFGVIERKLDDDGEAYTEWSNPNNAKAYDYSAVDKEKDENEYNRRHNNRKRLNMRLSEACKAAAALVDRGVKSDQLKLVENSNKEVEAVIDNAPADLRGDEQKNGPRVTFGKRTAQEGAKLAPNVAALVKAASEAHKATDETGTGDRADKGGDRSGDAKLGMSDEDFGAIVNNLRRAIMAQEGRLTPEMVKQLQTLVPYIDEEIQKTLNAPKQESLDDLSDEETTTEDQQQIEDNSQIEEETVKEPAPAQAAKSNKRK
jgi:hypothetical protein